MRFTDDLAAFVREDLAGFLGRLLARPDELETVAARSYRHDNGFVKVVLATGDATGGALRLHVWSNGGGRDSNVHNHCWDFTSFVLTGQLEYEEFDVDDDGPVRARHHTYVPAGDLEYELRPVRATGLRPAASGVRRSGELYVMDASTLHRTGATPGMRTVTLLAQGRRQRDRADVYVTRPDGVRTTAENAPLTATELTGYLDEVHAQLS